MKDLIIIALDTAFALLEKQEPETKKETKNVEINNVSPLDIVNFMKENNIPNSAYFGFYYNYGSNKEMCLCYEVDIPITEKDRLAFKRHRFTDIAWKFVFDTLTSNNYKRVGYNSGLLDQFKDTTVFDMYINKEFNRLVEYYKLPFVKIVE